MDIDDIEKLADVKADPAVSIMCRLDRRRPGNFADPLRLDALRKRAIAAVLNTYDERTVTPLLGRLEAAVASVDLTHPSESVAILVTGDESHVLPLTFPVYSRVVVDETFAIRGLVNAAQQTIRTRVLVLAAERARCFEASGNSLEEIFGFGFPLHISPPKQEDTPHRDRPIGEHENAEVHRRVLRAVDTALAALQAREHRPIVVVAPVRELAYFDEVTRFGKDIIGRVHGNHLADSAQDIEQIVDAVLTAAVDARATAAVMRANQAVGAHATAGLENVGAAARAGRGDELIVEETLRVANASIDGAEDAVDEVIDAVLAHGGSVTTVAESSLADHGGIVLLLRY